MRVSCESPCSAYLLRPCRPLHVACAELMQQHPPAAAGRISPCATCPLAEICKHEMPNYDLPAVTCPRRRPRAGARPGTRRANRAARKRVLA